MARAVNRLTAKAVATAATPGLYPDGNGLYLQVSPALTRSWVKKYALAGKRHEMGLGPLRLVSLAQARAQNLALDHQLRNGIDPLAEERLRRQQAERPAELTFAQCMEQYLIAKRPEWKGGGSEAQWRASLSTYALPIIGKLPVGAIDTAFTTHVLDPIWLAKPPTANRVRNRIELILDWATARGYRQGENPARWRGHLETLLAKPSKVAAVKPHAALPAAEVPLLLAALRGREAVSARALEAVVFTVGRANEILGWRWDEIDGDVWTTPASRMKGIKGREGEHRKPLSTQLLALLEHMRTSRIGDFVFPGQREGRPLTKNSLRLMLEAVGYGHATPHGLRASFATWAHDLTSFTPEIIEACLAHRVGSSTARAYNRGDVLGKRARLMQRWADYVCAPAPGAGADRVVAIGARR